MLAFNFAAERVLCANSMAALRPLFRAGEDNRMDKYQGQEPCPSTSLGVTDDVRVRVFVCEAEVVETSAAKAALSFGGYVRAEARTLRNTGGVGSRDGYVPGVGSDAALAGGGIDISAAADDGKKISKRRDAVDPRERKQPKLPKDLNQLGKGSWAESEFQSRTMALGFAPFRCWMGHSYLDFVLEWQGSLLRIQVKSAWELHRYHYFIPTTRNSIYRGDRKPYGKTIDFLAAYVPPLDIWYIIPAAAINTKTKGFCLYPMDGEDRRDKNGNKRRRRLAFDYEVYREAWHLLKEHHRSADAFTLEMRKRNAVKPRGIR